MNEGQSHSLGRAWLKPGVALCAIPCLLGLSALLAHLQNLQAFRPPHATFNFGAILLMRDAIPWLLQYAAVALLFMLLNHTFIHATRPQLKLALVFPLGVGLVYWGWTVAKYWRQETVPELVADMLLEGIGQNLGGPPFGEVLFRFLSLLVSPFHARGTIIEMQEWGFALAGASTMLVIGYWLFAAKWIGVSEQELRVAGVRQWIRLILTMFVYLLPVVVDSLFALLRLSREMQR